MDENRASSQIFDRWSLNFNLMPTKEVTKLNCYVFGQYATKLTSSFFIWLVISQKIPMLNIWKLFYKTFDEIKHKYYDGLIVTELLLSKCLFEEVDYWQELTQVFDWSKKHVYSTLHLCWGAQAGLYYKHGVDKVPLSEKLSGIYKQTVDMPEKTSL